MGNTQVTKLGRGRYAVQARTTLDGKDVSAEFQIMMDTETERVAGRCLWPITGIVGGMEIEIDGSPLVLSAGTRLRESVDIVGRMCDDGFRSIRGRPEPAGGIGCYE